MRSRLFATTAAALALATGLACATSPLGRSQLKLFPESELASMGAAAFGKLKEETPVSRDASVNRYVRCVAQAIAARADGSGAPDSWDVTVFRDDSANAFALPGGKIGVHTGLLDVAKNQDQLAAVIGHEVAHVLAGHANERVSTQFAAQSGLALAQIAAGTATPGQQALFAALGLGTQVGVLLPFSRAQEREADLLGLDLMAEAGFDPRESVGLWQNMSAAGGGQPPEFLSTHPSHGTRVDHLQQRMGHAMEIYQRARAQGRRPSC